MQITCISCKSIFLLDSSHVKATGTLVRCSKCECIFKVYPPPAINDEPVGKVTNINLSLLDRLFEVDQTNMVKSIFVQTSEGISVHSIDETDSIMDFEEEEDDQYPEIENIDLAEFTGHTENEDLIEWDIPPNKDNPTDGERIFYNGKQDIDINEV